MTDQLWQQGRLDQRCRACGRGEAAGAFCSGCGSKDVSYVPHEAGKPCLASGRTGRAVMPRRVPARPVAA